MQRAGDDFLAGAALPGDQHADGRRRDAPYLCVDAQHCSRTAPQVTEPRRVLRFGLQRLDLAVYCRRTRQARQDALELLDIDRLDQIVRRPHAQRMDGSFDAGVTRHQHDLGLDPHFLVVEQAHAAAVGEVQIEQYQLRGLQCQLAAGAGEVMRHRDGQALGGQQCRQHLGGIGVVVDDQGVRHGSCGARAPLAEMGRSPREAETGPSVPACPTDVNPVDSTPATPQRSVELMWLTGRLAPPSRRSQTSSGTTGPGSAPSDGHWAAESSGGEAVDEIRRAVRPPSIDDTRSIAPAGRGHADEPLRSCS